MTPRRLARTLPGCRAMDSASHHTPPAPPRGLPRSIALRLPVTGWPQATFQSTVGFDAGRLLVNGSVVAAAPTRADLERGVNGHLPAGGDVRMWLDENGLRVRVGERDAVHEDTVIARPVPEAFYEGFLALMGSLAGLVACWLTLVAATAMGGAGWRVDLAHHLATVHLLLALGLFPAALWGQRIGLRGVRIVCATLVAVDLAVAAAGPGLSDLSVTVFGGIGAAFFLWAAAYGGIAWRRADPARALPELEG